MNKKYENYINHIVNDIESPYFKNMRDMYGLSPDEYESVLSKVYNLPVTIIGNSVYDEYSNKVYLESISGYWVKYDYDNDGNQIYREDVDGNWSKYEYDADGNVIYLENSDGFWVKYEYDNQGNEIYFENSDGYIEDNR